MTGSFALRLTEQTLQEVDGDVDPVEGRQGPGSAGPRVVERPQQRGGDGLRGGVVGSDSLHPAPGGEQLGADALLGARTRTRNQAAAGTRARSTSTVEL